MTEEQTIVPIKPEELVGRVTELNKAGYRLVQICATKTDNIELNYTFDNKYRFMDLKIALPSVEVEIPSISSVYWSAFLYENELKDLFNIKVKDIVIDYKGTFYKTSVKWPFNPPAPEKPKEEKKND